jgi:hypothetical protein
VAIGERQRQPRCLLTLADKNLRVGIGGLAIGGRHYIASSRIRKGRSPSDTIISHPASRLKPSIDKDAAWLEHRGPILFSNPVENPRPHGGNMP